MSEKGSGENAGLATARAGFRDVIRWALMQASNEVNAENIPPVLLPFIQAIKSEETFFQGIKHFQVALEGYKLAREKPNEELAAIFCILPNDWEREVRIFNSDLVAIVNTVRELGLIGSEIRGMPMPQGEAEPEVIFSVLHANVSQIVAALIP